MLLEGSLCALGESTLAAISTPLGVGGIGVIRISGPLALQVAGRVFRCGRDITHMAGYTSVLGRVYDGEQPVDDAILQVFRAPKSYTGEDVAELSCHGGLWVMRRVLRLCLANGAEPAGPGEFTKRAFLNGKLGLTQAEAVMDILCATGDGAMKAAITARDGATGRKVKELAERLVFQSAHIAAWADFPEEDLERLDLNLLRDDLTQVLAGLDALLKGYDAGRLMREGVPAVIAGKPNVGKSTLMNLLSGEERSIVTDIPGTTRDVIEESVRLGDFVLNLADTAGIRETADPVEIAGVERSRARLRTAGLIFAVFDSADSLTAEDFALLESLPPERCIAVINKIDLEPRLDRAAIEAILPRVVTISAKDGSGLDELRAAAEDLLGLTDFDPTAAVVVNERQKLCAEKARASLEEGLAALGAGMLDACAVSIDYAIGELLTLTGERASDRVVDEVFSRFCVGK
jgi:tRNA modification GTPase